ncbi:MAG: hypothetical protein K9J12_05175 [Melioribacteraceae bacterium]|nr:hypothetical protein [Melioribacteraceae bacterium]MCF8262967.1 hypothetical protein [Melioribacteraceae bacterium]MCF8413325.1 hypothetical protein [Melioribacteraceae bacterium]MCF8430600.1 hypothetical protein [Melioribacteraceae bacterium]
MSKSNQSVFVLVCLFSFFSTEIIGQTGLSENFSILEPFVGKTWKGIVDNGDDGSPIYDIGKWDIILNGNAIKVIHSVNNGSYAGETTYYWNTEKGLIEYFYFTTAGFYTTGTTEKVGEKIVNHEFITGDAGGIKEVKSVVEFINGNEYQVFTNVKSNNKWLDGGVVIYKVDNSAKVILEPNKD